MSKPAAQPAGDDDLTAITGVGPALQRKLKDHGIKNYAQIAGLSDGYDTTIVRTGKKEDNFYICYLQGGKLVAVDSINAPRSHMMARRVIGEVWRDDLLPPL